MRPISLLSRAAAVVVLAGAVALPACAQGPFFDFAGYSYLDGPAFTVGTNVSVVARFNPYQPDPVWPLDLDGNEYTVVVQDLAIGQVISYGSFLEIHYQGGTCAVYEDPLKNSAYAANPPNALVPASFVDGTVDLVGDFTEMVLFYDTATGVGTVSGLVDWTGGVEMGAIGDPQNWTFFGGVSNHDGLGIPTGYDLAWDPQLYGPAPVPVEPSSWGSLKARYRR